MKSGIIRKIDKLGRLVIPKSYRRSLMIEDWDEIEIILGTDSITLKPYKTNCILCGGCSEVVLYNSKKICNYCIEGINNAK